ncbi:sensor histidine kinase [Streptomonospora alba]|uniref:sensor histidine kinase n=1 Tax=Streptomonospora alba TaxID=183763 RepID=UPI000A013024|nr:histidine kinase [Streptomonospora alba]
MEPPTAPHAGPRPSPGRLVGLGARRLIGLALGAVIAAGTLVLLVLVGMLLPVSLPWPRAHRACRRRAAAAVTWLVHLDLRRLAGWLDCDIQPAQGRRRFLEYLLLRIPWGLITGYLIHIALLMALLVFGGVVWHQATGTSHRIDIALPGVVMSADSRTVGLAFGAVLLMGIGLGSGLLSALERRFARLMLGPSLQDRMMHRIGELTDSRAGVVHAVDEERRRIERDLHDGVQQRVVALAMLLGRARRGSDTERAARLVGQAHEESQRLAEEIREVAWRVYPTVLDEAGLAAALGELAERAGVPVRVTDRLAHRPAQVVETAAYFIVREAVANAVKHAGAAEITVDLADSDPATVTVRVTDDGRGGAETQGGGLAGLARRVAALDGRLEVCSPRGGPTVVTAWLPRAGSGRAQPSAGSGRPARTTAAVHGDTAEGRR